MLEYGYLVNRSKIIKNKTRLANFQLTDSIENPLDLCEHLPFRIAVVSNLLALNRDWHIRNLCELDPKEMRVLINIGSYMPIKSADIAYQSRMDSYSVSRAVKKLLAAELIDTQNDLHKKNVKNLVWSALDELHSSVNVNISKYTNLKPRDAGVFCILVLVIVIV